MLKTVAGVYRKGAIELDELPENVDEGATVLVTFLESSKLSLRARGIGKRQAANLRARLQTFADEWESPEMDIYDNYDANKSRV